MEKEQVPYSKYFIMRNKDNKNYVLYKDFYFYSIIAIYIFYFWYLITVIMHYKDFDKKIEGKAIVALAILVLVGTFLILTISFFSPNNYPYSMAGIIFLIFIIDLALLFWYYDKTEIDGDYSQDPVSIAITFLLTYTFVSYFTI